MKDEFDVESGKGKCDMVRMSCNDACYGEGEGGDVMMGSPPDCLSYTPLGFPISALECQARIFIDVSNGVELYLRAMLGGRLAHIFGLLARVQWSIERAEIRTGLN